MMELAERLFTMRTLYVPFECVCDEHGVMHFKGKSTLNGNVGAELT